MSSPFTRCFTPYLIGVSLVLASVALLQADGKKSEEDQRIELIRGLGGEFATVKAYLPNSRKALDFESNGTWDTAKWEQAGRELGPAARIGDQIQITKITIDKNAIALVLNNGPKNGSSWKDHIQVGLGGSTRPLSGNNAPTNARAGATIIVHFRDGLGDIASADVKKMLTPVLDFDKHSATEQAIDTLTPEVKAAVLAKKAIEGMDRDEVLLSMGRPNRKTRESKDGVDYEDWIYGEPPGRITFVTFAGPKVSRIKETYAGLGGSIAESKAP
jgi:hypothetical protein